MVFEHLQNSSNLRIHSLTFPSRFWCVCVIASCIFECKARAFKIAYIAFNIGVSRVDPRLALFNVLVIFIL